MTTQGTVPHPGYINLPHLDPDRSAMEHAALNAVLASGIFENKPRMASLLKYICERYFDGDIDAI